MQVTVKLTPEAARKLRATAAARRVWLAELRAIADDTVALSPMHDTDEEPLAAYFQIDLPDAGSAVRVLKMLNARKDVMGAYLTPKAELA